MRIVTQSQGNSTAPEFQQSETSKVVAQCSVRKKINIEGKVQLNQSNSIKKMKHPQCSVFSSVSILYLKLS